MEDQLDQFTTEELRAFLEMRSSFDAFRNRTFLSLEREFGRKFDVLRGVTDYRADRSSPEDPLANIPSVKIFDEIRVRQKAVYGDDDRIEVVDIPDPNRQELAKSVAAIVPVDDVMPISDTLTSISSLSMADKYELKGKPICNREPFHHQPASAVGTAFLIAPTIVATAHHCINADNFETVRLIFDFEVDANGTAPTQFAISQLFSVRGFIAGDFVEDGADWSVVELDRPVQGRTPLTYRRDGKASNGTPLFVIGHPLGLPKKIAGDAQIRINTHADYFVANLDTYGGNSGSPVFNALTHEVEGILVRGVPDLAPLGNCYASLVCPTGGCRGEDCSRTDPIAHHIQPIL